MLHLRPRRIFRRRGGRHTRAGELHAREDLVQSALLGRGICGVTDGFDRGDCAHGTYGAFGFDSRSSIDACLQSCASCGRCNYISFSAQQRACDWYSDCPLLLQNGTSAELTRIFSGFTTHRLVRVGSMQSDARSSDWRGGSRKKRLAMLGTADRAVRPSTAVYIRL